MVNVVFNYSVMFSSLKKMDIHTKNDLSLRNMKKLLIFNNCWMVTTTAVLNKNCSVKSFGDYVPVR